MRHYACDVQGCRPIEGILTRGGVPRPTPLCRLQPPRAGVAVTRGSPVRLSTRVRSRVLDAARAMPGVIEPVPEVLQAQIHLDNLRRLRVVVTVAGVVSLLHLAVFAVMDPTGPVEARWRVGIMVAHSVLLAGAVVMRLAVRRIEAVEDGGAGAAEGGVARAVEDGGAGAVEGGVARARALGILALAGALGLGVAIAVVDQLITDSITPFLVANALTGLVLVLTPRVTVPTYLLGVLVFAVALPVTQSDPSVLTSNQVNGLTAGAIGLGLSLLRWRAEVRDHALMRRIAVQQQELEQRNTELAHLAAYDPLTGVLNRRQFELQFDQEIARHLRTGEPCSLVLFDLDHFKEVNDAYGHPVGDALLHTIAEVVTGRLRASDLLARWGGEEFLALLPATDRDGAVAIAETLRAHVGSVDFEVGVGEPLSMTISLGVAEVAPAHPEALADAYRRADAALYDAKRRGRDRVGVDAGSSADPPGG